MKRQIQLSALVVMVLVIAGCASAPDAQRIKEDLVGKVTTGPGRVWQFQSLAQFQSLEIEAVASSGKAREYQVAMSLLSEAETYLAKGTVTYVLQGGRWDFRAVSLTEFFSVQQKVQLETLETMQGLGHAYSAYMSDQVIAGKIGERTAEPLTPAELKSQLQPSETFFYMIDVPERDGWGNPLEIWRRPARWPRYDVLIRSAGSDGRFGPESSYGSGEFRGSNHEHDIVWADGYYLDFPSGSD